MNLSVASLFGYRNGTIPISAKAWGKLEQAEMTLGRGDQAAISEPEMRKYTGNRMIPVLGWAHAGEAVNYDEIPKSWQERVPTECRDPKAFAIRLEGESMRPEYSEGDLLIVQPSEEIYNGCLAVVRMKSDGYIFRRIELRAGYLRMIPLNPQWSSEDLPMEQVAWVYPVWGMWRQVWKR